MEKWASWNPWRELRGHPEIELFYADLSCGAMLLYEDGRWVILLDRHLDLVGRSCALAHELVHYERRHLLANGIPAAVVEVEERAVRAETARRLVPPWRLLEFVKRRAAVESVTVAAIAAEFEVTETVAALSAALLEDADLAA